MSEPYKLAGHRFDTNTDRCVTCGLVRWRVIADRKCCYGKNSPLEDVELADAREHIWKQVMETAAG